MTVNAFFSFSSEPFSYFHLIAVGAFGAFMSLCFEKASYS